MRPLAAVTGFLFGSCVAITISLLLVLVVFLILGDEYPRLQSEFGSLTGSTLIFLGMTIVSAGSFYTMLIRHPLRYLAQAAMWVGILATGWYYWP